MLKMDIETDEEGMTVPYPPLFDDVRKNYGFLDVRGRPDLASQIAEGSASSAMRNLLIELVQPHSKVFSVGCDLGVKRLSEERRPHTAGGYIQIMDVTYADRAPESYARYAAAVAEMLKARSQKHEWRVHFVLTPVAFKLDGFSDMTGSLWIWFHAFANNKKDAIGSRETLITGLGQALTDCRNTLLLEGPDDNRQ
jgi:hypothetical protein